MYFYLLCIKFKIRNVKIRRILFLGYTSMFWTFLSLCINILLITYNTVPIISIVKINDVHELNIHVII